MTSEPIIDWACDYDILDPEYIVNPYPVWDDLRATCPVAHSPRWGGSWMPTRYEDVFAVAHDVAAFSSREVGVLGVPGQWNPAQGLKPEQAEGLRKLLVALAADVRLVLVRLVLQLVRLRGAKSQSREEQVRAALETREAKGLRSGGFGMLIVRQIVDELVYNERGNEVLLIKHLPQA